MTCVAVFVFLIFTIDIILYYSQKQQGGGTVLNIGIYTINIILYYSQKEQGGGTVLNIGIYTINIILYYSQKDLGGGTVFDIGIYTINIIIWAMGGDKPEEIQAVGLTNDQVFSIWLFLAMSNTTSICSRPHEAIGFFISLFFSTNFFTHIFVNIFPSGR